MRPSNREAEQRAALIALDARIAAWRTCHLRGFLDEEERDPIVRVEAKEILKAWVDDLGL